MKSGRRVHFRTFDEVNCVRYNYRYLICFYTPFFMVLKRLKKNSKFKSFIVWRKNYNFYYIAKRRYENFCKYYYLFNHKLWLQITIDTFKLRKGIYKEYIIMYIRRPIKYTNKPIKLFCTGNYNWS